MRRASALAWPVAGLFGVGVAASCAAPDAPSTTSSPGETTAGAALFADDRVHVPRRASDRLVLSYASMRLGVSWAGARAVEGTRHGRSATWPGALDGADVSVKWDANGFEDAIRFAARPSEEVVRYKVDLVGVAGLRLVDDVLELLDASGTPQLRMSRPYVVDAAGRRRARTSIEGCDFSADVRPPWGRAVVAPRSDRCTIVVRWDGAGATYPATLDPIWSTTTATMTEGRVGRSTANPLVLVEGGPHDGLVYTAGGLTADRADGVVIGSAEMFDPTSGTWSAVAPLPIARRGLMFASVVVASGETRVLVAGGCATAANCDAKTEAWLYDPENATTPYAPAAAMVTPRAVGFVARLGDGRVLLTGGGGALGVPMPVTTDLYDPKTDTWSPGGAPSTGRIWGGSTLLPDGRFLIAGGRDLAIQGAMGTAEIFDPATDTWSMTSDLKIERFLFDLVGLADGRVVAVGGQTQFSFPTFAELFDPATGAFTLDAGEMSGGATSMMTTLLPNHFVAAIGGGDTSDVRVLDPSTMTWSDAEPLDTSWTRAGKARLLDGRTLFAGGVQDVFADPPAATNEFFIVSTYEDATPCALDGECASGHCVDGVCCNEACDDACSACTVAKGSGADGVCGAAIEGTADARCGDAHHTCGNTGVCAAGGVCETVPLGDPCAGCDVNQIGTCDVTSDGTHVCACVGARCVDDHTLQTPDGPVIDCAPYLCAEDDCRHSCNTSTDCVDGYLCDANHHCIFEGQPGDAPPPTTPEPDGCSCSAVGADASTPVTATLGLIGLGLGALARRRHHGGERRSERVRGPSVP